jgi:hypothetical protein
MVMKYSARIWNGYAKEKERNNSRELRGSVDGDNWRESSRGTVVCF